MLYVGSAKNKECVSVIRLMLINSIKNNVTNDVIAKVFNMDESSIRRYIRRLDRVNEAKTNE